MTTVRLSANAIGLEHKLAPGDSMTGVLSADTDPAFNSDRAVLEYAELSGSDGEGLFDPHQFVDRDNPYCTFLQIMGDGAWEVYVTSGLEDGIDGTTVDDPDRDQEIATDTGNAHIRMNIELLPRQKIRVVMAGGAEQIRVIVHFATTLNCGGRMIS